MSASGLVLLFGLAQDNVGTAFRHRGQIFWIVALLAVAAVSRWSGAGRDDALGTANAGDG